MKFQVASDIHLEFYKNKERGLPYLEITAPYLILAGDIGNPFMRNYLIYLTWASQNYQWVFLLSGNHEYYSPRMKRSMKEVDMKIQEIVSNFQNVSYLNLMDEMEVESSGVVVIGRTLWTNFSDCSDELKHTIKATMNDYSHIHLDNRLIEPDDVAQLHQDHLNFLETTLNRLEEDETVKKVIVVSHHAPSRLMLHPDYNNDVFKVAYANQLDDLIISHPKISAWVSGHTHHSEKLSIGSTTLISNCLGYRLSNDELQSTNYHPDRSVEVIFS